MKTSPAARAMTQSIRDYLMGFAAGHDYTPGGGDIEEPSGDRLRPYQTKVFPTRSAARKAAEALPVIPGKRRYVRPYIYSTPTPANARGMDLFNPEQETTEYLDV